MPRNHFHGVEKLPLLIDAEFVDGDDVRVVELGGDLRLLDKAEHIGLAAGVEHDLHGDGALGGVLPRVEDRAHAAVSDDAADSVALFRQQLVRQVPTDCRLRGRQRDVLLARRALSADLDRHVAEANGLVRKKARGLVRGERLLVDEGAVAGAEVFEEEAVVIDREARVTAGEEWGVGANLRIVAASDGIFARRQGHVREFCSLVSEDDLGEGDVHERKNARRLARGKTRVGGCAFPFISAVPPRGRAHAEPHPAQKWHR